MALTPEAQTRIAELRMKCSAGNVSMEDLREAIILLRGNRRSATEAAGAAKKRAAKKPARSAADMLKEL